MSSHPLRIAYGDEPSPRADVVVETLRSLGHEVVRFDDESEFLAAPEPDLYLIGRTFPGGASGLDCLAALRRAGRTAPVLLLDERPVFDELRRAIELGATDLLLHPLEEGELAAAIERGAVKRPPRARIDSEPQAHACERTYPCEEGSVGRAAREVAAFLVNEGVASAHRVRIASAVAEVVDNACRHAYPRRKGEITVRVEVQRTRVQLSVEDAGQGFDVARARLERIPAALPGSRSQGRVASSSTGLGRVERLCEAHAISSGSDGTRVELTFELTPVRFDEESEHLAETDFLDPSRARSLIASLRKGRADLSGVPPALALTIGRIIGGLDAEVRPAPRK